MTFFRHFIERRDFSTLVATNSRHLGDYELPYEPLKFEAPFWWRRLGSTRLHPWVIGIQALYGSWMLPSHVLKAVRDFEPEAVFTMAGSWDWTALAAQKAARKLNVPLVASFNDWFDYPWFAGHPSLKKSVEARFRRFYCEADLALCTSDAMRESLGEHRNAHVLYPAGAVMPETHDPYQPSAATPEHSLNVLFGGSLGEWYGPMLERLVTACGQMCQNVQYRIFGGLQTWSKSFEHRAIEMGIFGGRIALDKLQEEAARADLLLLPMGFDPRCAHIERTSFKTKFLDYLSFRRPILVWGPDYCSAVRVAREFDAAECVTNPDPQSCAVVIQRLSLNPQRRAVLMRNALHMYEDRFHPDKIHNGLVREMFRLRRKM